MTPAGRTPTQFTFPEDDAKLDEELMDAAVGDRKLAGMLAAAAEEFERTGKVGPVKERLIKRRHAKLKRRARHARN